LIVAGTSIFSAGYILFAFGTIKASRRIHERLLKAVLGTTFRFLDTTPAGRIIARFTRDIGDIDTGISGLVQNLADMSFQMLLKLSGVLFFTPVFFFPAAVFLIIGNIVAQKYMKAQLSVKR
jgi:ABC-type multidrug transport system fused ATPase/permease subunit